jgi:hypothetical protein
VDDPGLALLSPSQLFTRADVLAIPCPTPRSPGVYAWYLDEISEAVPTEGCHRALGHTLLYVGISPSAPPTNGAAPSRQTLRSRVRYHYWGNAFGSTLRLTLGCPPGRSPGYRLAPRWQREDADIHEPR